MEFYFSKNKSVNKLPGVHFLQDHIGTSFSSPWDDYTFIVTFKAHYVKDEKLTFLGELKILANEYSDTSKFFVQCGGEPIGEGKSLRITDCLQPDKVVSLATGIDFYERIRTVLDLSLIEEYFAGVCDAGFFIESYDSYVTWRGFELALLRDGPAAEARIKKGYRVAIGNYSPEPTVAISIDTLGETFEPITFSFNNEEGINYSNINLLIGSNGTGKSHILKHVTELLTGIHPGVEIWPYFHKLIVVAYSPFESFYCNQEVAGILAKSKGAGESLVGQLTSARLKRLQKINKYSYVGFKKDRGSFSPDWPPEHSVKCLLQIIDYDEVNRWKEQSRLEMLLKTLKLSVSFDSLALKTKSGQLCILGVAPSGFSNEQKKEFEPKSGICFVKGGKEVSLSSGQKIYSYMMPALVCEIEKESLIILDEPELYLHPSLEIGLITMLRSLLAQTNSYALIATHSAIIAREVRGDGVRILRKEGDVTTVSLPTFETYGETLDTILGEAFDDYEIEKPYQRYLNKLIKQCDGSQEALKLVGGVGDEALAYVLSKFNTDDEVDVVVEEA